MRLSFLALFGLCGVAAAQWYSPFHFFDNEVGESEEKNLHKYNQLPLDEQRFRCADRDDGLYSLGCEQEYVSCVAGRAISQKCPEGLLFNNHSNSCEESCDVRPNIPEIGRSESGGYSTVQPTTAADKVYFRTTETVFDHGSSYSFRCADRDDGLYSLGCKQEYVSCVAGRTVSQKCPEGLLFNEHVNACETSCDTITTPTIGLSESRRYAAAQSAGDVYYRPTESVYSHSSSYPFSCTGKSDGLYPLGCVNEFVYCVDGKTIVEKCAEGLVFAEKIGACAVSCDFQPELPAQNPTDAPEIEHCVDLPDGTYSYGCSSSFVVCFEGIKHVQTCPDGLLFNAQTGYCDYECSTSTSGRSFAPAKTAVYTNPHETLFSDSQTYSSSTQAAVTMAATTRVFDENRALYPSMSSNVGLDNNWSNIAHGPSNTEEATVTVAADPERQSIRHETTTPVAAAGCRKGDTAVLGECSTVFLRCKKGNMVQSTCPSGTIFDSELRLCVYELAKCNLFSDKNKFKSQSSATGEYQHPAGSDTVSSSSSSWKYQSNNQDAVPTHTTAYSHNQQRQDSSSSALCSGRSDGFYAMGCSNAYFICHGDVAFKKVCPADLVFDEVAKTCNYRNVVAACGAVAQNPLEYSGNTNSRDRSTYQSVSQDQAQYGPTAQSQGQESHPWPFQSFSSLSQSGSMYQPGNSPGEFNGLAPSQYPNHDSFNYQPVNQAPGYQSSNIAQDTNVNSATAQTQQQSYPQPAAQPAGLQAQQPSYLQPAAQPAGTYQAPVGYPSSNMVQDTNINSATAQTQQQSYTQPAAQPAGPQAQQSSYPQPAAQPAGTYQTSYAPVYNSRVVSNPFFAKRGHKHHGHHDKKHGRKHNRKHHDDSDSDSREYEFNYKYPQAPRKYHPAQTNYQHPQSSSQYPAQDPIFYRGGHGYRRGKEEKVRVDKLSHKSADRSIVADSKKHYVADEFRGKEPPYIVSDITHQFPRSHVKRLRYDYLRDSHRKQKEEYEDYVEEGLAEPVVVDDVTAADLAKLVTPSELELQNAITKAPVSDIENSSTLAAEFHTTTTSVETTTEENSSTTGEPEIDSSGEKEEEKDENSASDILSAGTLAGVVPEEESSKSGAKMTDSMREEENKGDAQEILEEITAVAKEMLETTAETTMETENESEEADTLETTTAGFIMDDETEAPKTAAGFIMDEDINGDGEGARKKRSFSVNPLYYRSGQESSASNLNQPMVHDVEGSLCHSDNVGNLVPLGVCQLNFVFCAQDRSVLAACPVGEVFDSERIQCVDTLQCGKAMEPVFVPVEDLWTKAEPEHEPVNTVEYAPAAAPHIDSLCSGRENGPRGLGCAQEFIICAGGISHKMNCPKDLYYDESTRECTQPDLVAACVVDVVDIGSTAAPYEEYQDQSIALAQDQLFSYQPHNQNVVSDSSFVTSPVPAAYEGGNSYGSSFATSATDGGSYASCKGKPNGSLGMGCSGRFIICSNQYTHFMNCPANLMFDVEHNRCEYEQFVAACGGYPTVAPVRLESGGHDYESTRAQSSTYHGESAHSAQQTGSYSSIGHDIVGSYVPAMTPRQYQPGFQTEAKAPAQYQSSFQTEAKAPAQYQSSFQTEAMAAQHHQSGFQTEAMVSQHYQPVAEGMISQHYQPAADAMAPQPYQPAAQAEPSRNQPIQEVSRSEQVVNVACHGRPDGPVSIGCSRSFVVCVNGAAHQMDCPEGLAYSAEDQKCDETIHVRACGGTAQNDQVFTSNGYQPTVHAEELVPVADQATGHLYGPRDREIHASVAQESHLPQQVYAPPAREAYVHPAQEASVPSAQEAYVPAHQQASITPGQQAYVPASQQAYVPASQQAYVPAAQEAYIPPAPEAFAIPAQQAYVPAAQQAYVPHAPEAFVLPAAQQAYVPHAPEAFVLPAQEAYVPAAQQVYVTHAQEAYVPQDQQAYVPAAQEALVPAVGTEVLITSAEQASVPKDVYVPASHAETNLYQPSNKQSYVKPLPMQDGSSVRICVGRADGPVGRGCSKHFFVCVNGVALEMSCPDGLVFSEGVNKCEEAHLTAACGGESRNEQRVEGTYEKVESTSQVHHHQGSSYVQSSPGKSQPTSHRYPSKEAEIVGSYQEAQSHVHQAPMDDVCVGREDGSKGSGCSGSYVVCANQIAYHMECPAGLKFDESNGKCDLAEFVMTCGGSATVAPVSLDSVIGTSSSYPVGEETQSYEAPEYKQPGVSTTTAQDVYVNPERTVYEEGTTRIPTDPYTSKSVVDYQVSASTSKDLYSETTTTTYFDQDEPSYTQEYVKSHISTSEVYGEPEATVYEERTTNIPADPYTSRKPVDYQVLASSTKKDLYEEVTTAAYIEEETSYTKEYEKSDVSTVKDVYGESIYEERTTRIPEDPYTSRQPVDYQVLASSTKKDLYEEVTTAAYIEDETSYTKEYEKSDVSTSKEIYGENEATAYKERTTRIPEDPYTSRQPVDYQVLASSTKKDLYEDATTAAYIEDETSYTKEYEKSDVLAGKYVYGEPESTVSEQRTTRIPEDSYTSRQPVDYQVLASSTKKDLYEEVTTAAYIEDETSYTREYEKSDVSTSKEIYEENEATAYKERTTGIPEDPYTSRQPVDYQMLASSTKKDMYEVATTAAYIEDETSYKREYEKSDVSTSTSKNVYGDSVSANTYTMVEGSTITYLPTGGAQSTVTYRPSAFTAVYESTGQPKATVKPAYSYQTLATTGTPVSTTGGYAPYAAGNEDSKPYAPQDERTGETYVHTEEAMNLLYDSTFDGNLGGNCAGRPDGSIGQGCSTSFVLCSGGEALEMNCPPGLFYDETLGACDYPMAIAACSSGMDTVAPVEILEDTLYTVAPVPIVYGEKVTVAPVPIVEGGKVTVAPVPIVEGSEATVAPVPIRSDQLYMAADETTVSSRNGYERGLKPVPIIHTEERGDYETDFVPYATRGTEAPMPYAEYFVSSTEASYDPLDNSPLAQKYEKPASNILHDGSDLCAGILDGARGSGGCSASFIMCSGGRMAASLNCPLGLIFDPDTTSCAPREGVKICAPAALIAPEPSEAFSDMTASTSPSVYVPVKSETDSYLVESTTNSPYVAEKMSDNTVTDEDLPPPRCASGALALGICSAKYTVCNDGVDYTLTCPEPLVFNDIVGVCEHAEFVKGCQREESNAETSTVPSAYENVTATDVTTALEQKSDCVYNESRTDFPSGYCIRRFTRCSAENVLISIDCPLGQLFDSQKANCVSAELCGRRSQALQDETILETSTIESSSARGRKDLRCSGVADGETVAIAKCRGAFLRCRDGVARVEHCANPQMVYSIKLKTCTDRDLLEQCSSRGYNKDSSVAKSSPSEKEGKNFCRLRKNGLYRHPQNCASILQCFGGDTFVHPSCVSGLVFNERSQQCDYRHNVPGCDTGSDSVSEGCRGAEHGAYLAHETECSLFYRCVWDHLEKMTCPKGTVFNPALSVCDWPQAVPQCQSLNVEEAQ